MRRIPALLIVLFLVGAMGSGLQAQDLSASFRAGTRGIGLGLNTSLARNLNGRIGVHYFNYATDGIKEIDDTDVSYDADGRLLFMSALVDWHPFANTFRLTGGIHYNGFKASSTVMPDEDIQVGSNIYTPEQVGTLNADVGFAARIAPYFGIGLGNAVNRRFSVLFDVGMLYSGQPEITMGATGMLGPTAEQAPQIEDNLSWARWYPVISLGVSARLHGGH